MNRALAVAVTTVTLTLVGVECHRTSTISNAEMASRVTVSACPPAVPVTRGEAPPRATLTVLFRPDPAVTPATPVSLKLDGEVTRNSMRVSAGDAAQFTLDAGLYVVRIAMNGYTSLDGRVRLTPGCEATMTLSPKKLAPN